MGLSGGRVAAELVLRSNFGKVLQESAFDLHIFVKAVETVSAKAREVGGTLTKNITLPLGGASAAALKASIDWETSFSNIRKTVNGTVPQIAAIGDAMRKMSTEIPVAASELADIAAAAGQFGIHTENIAEFTRVMADLGVATELTSIQAATGLSRIATITQMDQSKFSNLGSVLNALETQFNAGADEIVEYGLRIAGTAHTAGMAEADFLAFGSAAASVGIQAEAGGTALSKVFQTIFESVKTGNEQLSTFASTAGMTREAFQEAFGQDAAATTIAFVEGLGKIHASGGNIFAIMRDVEFQDSRLKNAMLALSGAGKELRTQLEASRAAWVANNSLTAEAAIRYGTTASLLQRLWNIVTHIATDIGAVLKPALVVLIKLAEVVAAPIKAIAAAMALLPTPIKLVIGAFVLLLASIGPLIFLVGAAATALIATAHAMLYVGIGAALLTGNIRMMGGVLGALLNALNPAISGLLRYAGVQGGLAEMLVAFSARLRATLGLLFNWSNATVLAEVAGRGLLGMLARWGELLGGLLRPILSLITWQRALLAVIVTLIYTTPALRAVFEDVIRIVVALGKIIGTALIDAFKFLNALLGAVVKAVLGAWQAFTSWLADLRQRSEILDHFLEMLEKLADGIAYVRRLLERGLGTDVSTALGLGILALALPRLFAYAQGLRAVQFLVQSVTTAQRFWWDALQGSYQMLGLWLTRLGKWIEGLTEANNALKGMKVGQGIAGAAAGVGGAMKLLGTSAPVRVVQGEVIEEAANVVQLTAAYRQLGVGAKTAEAAQRALTATTVAAAGAQRLLTGTVTTGVVAQRLLTGATVSSTVAQRLMVIVMNTATAVSLGWHMALNALAMLFPRVAVGVRTLTNALLGLTTLTSGVFTGLGASLQLFFTGLTARVTAQLLVLRTVIMVTIGTALGLGLIVGYIAAIAAAAPKAAEGLKNMAKAWMGGRETWTTFLTKQDKNNWLRTWIEDNIGGEWTDQAIKKAAETAARLAELDAKIRKTKLRESVNDIGMKLGELEAKGGGSPEIMHALANELENLKQQGAPIPRALQNIIDMWGKFSSLRFTGPSLTPFADSIARAKADLEAWLHPKPTAPVPTTGTMSLAPGSAAGLFGAAIAPSNLSRGVGTNPTGPHPQQRKDLADAITSEHAWDDDALEAYAKSLGLVGGAYQMFRTHALAGKKATEDAAAAADAYRKRIAELRQEMNGLAAVKAGAELAAAMKGVDVAGMNPEQKSTANATAKAAIAGIKQQGDVAKQSQAMQDLYMQMRILDDKTRDLKVGLHEVWSVGADGALKLTFVGKDAEDMMKGLGINTKEMAEELAKANFDKAAAKLAELTERMHENAAASKTLKLETRDLWIAAADTGVDTLTKRLNAVTLSYRDQRAALKTVNEGQLGYAEYVDRINQLSEKEVAAKAAVRTAYLNSLPPTKALLLLRKQEEIQDLRIAIAHEKNAIALGVLTKRLKEAEAEERRLLATHEKLAKWSETAARRLSQLSGAVGELADDFDEATNRIISKTAELLDALATFADGMADFAKGDKFSGVVKMAVGVWKAIDTLFDIGETEYEKNAKAAAGSFQELRTKLLTTYGDYDRLRQIAARTNTTIGNLNFDPNGDAFQQLDQLQREAAALEAAIAKLKAGLAMFASGAQTRVAAFAGAFKVGEDGKDVSLAAGLKKLGGTRTQVEAEFQRMGTYAGAAFLQTLREEGMAKAMEVAGPLFDTITELGDKVGLGLHGAAKAMADFFKIAKDNADVVQALDGIRQMVQGASDAAFLNSEMFTAFGEDVTLQFNRLQERGVSAGTAMALMQPTLQALWEAQKKYGYATDETTQKLIDEAVAAGIVGENQRDVNQQILEVLKSIAHVFGAEIPGAMGEMSSAAEREAQKVKDAMDAATRDRDINVDVNYNDPGYTATTPRGYDDGQDGQDPNMQAMGGFVRSLNYCATGGFIRPLLRAGGGGIDWTPRGTDTVPTMLTPGELVLNVAQQRNVAGALGSDPKALASAIASALKEGGIGGGEAGVVVLQSNGKPGDQFNAVLDSLPRALRQNKNGLRTALREALGIDA